MKVFHEHERRDLTQRCAHILAAAQLLHRQHPGYTLYSVTTPLTALSQIYGGPGVAFALRAWCDTFIDATPGAQRGQTVQLAFVTDAGDLQTGTDYAPHQWAADLVAARLAADQMGFYRLTAALPDDETLLGEHVFRLVELVAGALVAYADPAPVAPGQVKPGLYLARDHAERK